MQKASRFHKHLSHFWFHTRLLCTEIRRTRAFCLSSFGSFLFLIIIHSYFTMIAIELYKLIRQTELFVTVLYSHGPHPLAVGKLQAGVVARVCSLHLSQAEQGPKMSLLGKMPLKCCGCTCRSEVPQHLVKWAWASLVYLFFHGLEVLLQGEASWISHLISDALESISRSFLLLRKCLIFFSPEALTESLWLQYWHILSFKTIVYVFLDL